MIYDDQKNLQGFGAQLPANLQNQLGSFGTTPQIQQYEQMIRLLPSLPLDADERGAIVATIQRHLQRKTGQYVAMTDREGA